MTHVLRALRLIDEAIAALAAIVVGGTAVITVLAVFYRYVMNAALPWPEEVAGYLLVWLTFSGGYLAFRQRAHISFSLLVEKMPERAQRVVGLFNDLILAALLVFMTVYSYRMLSLLGGERLMASGLPQGIFMVSLLIFSVGGLIHLVVYRFEPPPEREP
ncbi:TRAP transporter small permease [Lutibaculum baratangense]|uniref:TRAP transporter small permease protein n=1 Tax=Lutibaculum baratangense AMV1 TaxID=631454 RepID=V4RC90_9HYPH|nr:TRAP transporter small permease [Lutibaculum baratangense]ESR23786.1 hypothetical protein N177_3016 [Lutibaculum baratangense AMV1]